MINAAENSGKLFSLLFNDDPNSKERLLLPTASDGLKLPERINEEITRKVIQEITSQPQSFPQPTGYIKYPSYDFF